MVLNQLCSLGNSECLTKASQLFKKWVTDGEAVDVNLRSVVYNYGMAGSLDFQTWSWMLERYKAEGNPQEKLKLLRALSSVQVRESCPLKESSLGTSQNSL